MEENLQSETQWSIQRYARFSSPSPPGTSHPTGGDWEFYDNSKEKLILSLTNSHQLVLTQGKTILETHLLSQSKSWMRGVAKSDSLLILYKVKGQTRRFRVKFTEGNAACVGCRTKLSKFFPVKVTPASEPLNEKQTLNTSQISEETANSNGPMAPRVLSGEVTLGELAQVVTGLTQAELPKMYQHSHLTDQHLDTFLRLCLADPNFPGFVGQVQKSLNKVIKETEL